MVSRCCSRFRSSTLNKPTSDARNPCLYAMRKSARSRFRVMTRNNARSSAWVRNWMVIAFQVLDIVSHVTTCSVSPIAGAKKTSARQHSPMLTLAGYGNRWARRSLRRCQEVDGPQREEAAVRLRDLLVMLHPQVAE